MKAWIITTVIIIAVLLLPIFYSASAQIDVLNNKAKLKVKLFKFTIISLKLRLDYGANIVAVNRQGKTLTLPLLTKNKFIDYLTAFFSILTKSINTTHYSLRFVFGSENAAQVGIVCGLYMTLLNTVCAVKFPQRDVLKFDVVPVYNEYAVRFNGGMRGFICIIEVLVSLVAALVLQINKNRKVMKNESD